MPGSRIAFHSEASLDSLSENNQNLFRGYALRSFRNGHVYACWAFLNDIIL